MHKSALVFLFLWIASPLAAQTHQWGLRGGIADGEAVIGGEFVMPIKPRFTFNPNVEVSGERASLNADLAIYLFSPTRVSRFWVGIGGALVHLQDQDLDAGVNVLAGIGVNRGDIFPYVQAKFTSPSDGDTYGTAVFGVRF